MIPQQVNNHRTEDLVKNEEDESLVVEVRKMMIRMFN
jgi:hypothetical protein